MNGFIQVISAVLGTNGSTTGNGMSARMQGIIAIVASYVVFQASRHGVALTTADVVTQLTALSATAGTLWYAFGSLRAVFNWGMDKWKNRTIPPAPPVA